MELNRIDEIAATLYDIATTLEEIKEDPWLVSAQTLESMRRSIEKAANSIDRIENKQPDTALSLIRQTAARVEGRR